jgi:AcrR family transcriptional regulator
MTSRSPAAGRQCILEQAQRLFALHGYHGVSIRDIVQACGLSNAALYYHFGSKQALFFEVLTGHIAAVARRLEDAGAGGGSVRGRLACMARAYAEILLESQSAIQTLLRDLAEFDQEEIQRVLPDLGRRFPAVMARALEDGIAAGEIRALDASHAGILLLGMINALCARRLYSAARTTLDQDVDLALDVLFEGIGV